MMKSLAVLALTFGVGASTIGCSGASTPTTPTGSSTAGAISSSAARALVDVSAMWQSEPRPDCPKPPVTYNGDVPAGLELPDKASVARQLAGVKSPGPESWVREKLGWVTKWLAKVRADIIDANTPGDSSMADGFNDYARHVRAELEAGHDIPDSALDGDFPEGCS